MIINDILAFLVYYFAGGKTPDVKSRTYTQIMREQMLQGEESEVNKSIQLNSLNKLTKFCLLFLSLSHYSCAKRFKRNQRMELWRNRRMVMQPKQLNRVSEADGIKLLMINLYRLKNQPELLHLHGMMLR